MSVLPFPAPKVEIEVRLGEDLAAICAMPEWVKSSGYAPIAFGVPKPGDLFYDPARDKVKTCGQWRYDDVETRPFVILSYGGR